MKKMLLLLAGMACLGMFVSCSDEPQEVVVTNLQGEVEWAGKATASSVSYKYAYDTTSAASSTASIAEGENDFATWSYTDNTKGNIKTYRLDVPVKLSSTNTEYVDIYITKVNSKYYDGKGEVIEVSGSPENDTFTIKEIVVNEGSYTYTFKDLKFTR